MNDDERYPLWCAEEVDADAPFHGPFSTEADALRVKIAILDECHGDGDVRIRRCRRLRASEVRVLDIEDFIEDVVLTADFDDPAKAWLPLDSEEACVRLLDDERAKAAFAVWLDEHAIVDLFVCQGDEAERKLEEP